MKTGALQPGVHDGLPLRNGEAPSMWNAASSWIGELHLRDAARISREKSRHDAGFGGTAIMTLETGARTAKRTIRILPSEPT
jgi:hypothetical protein